MTASDLTTAQKIDYCREADARCRCELCRGMVRLDDSTLRRVDGDDLTLCGECAAEQDAADAAELAESDRQFAAVEAAKQSAVRAVEAALRIEFRQAGGGSWYADHRGLKLRIADHAQIAGGGWNEATGGRMGEAAVEWIVGEGTAPPTRQEIRGAVAAAIRKTR